MTEEKWLLHKNLLKWLHAQQRLIGIPKIMDRTGYTESRKEVHTYPGLTAEIRYDIVNHLSMARSKIKERRAKHQLRPKDALKRWEDLSEEVLKKAIAKLDSHVTADKIVFENRVEDVRIGYIVAKSRGRKYNASAPGTFHISRSYFNCVGEAIYGKIPYLTDVLILHAHRVGRYKDAEAFKVRTYTFGPRKTMPEPQKKDEYLLIQGTAYAFDDTLMKASRRLEMDLVRAVTARLQKAEG